jgi:mannose-6-phosphate isomerase-like protein (cupin superfamily)
MPEIKIVNLPELGAAGGRQRKMLMNGPRFHTWINVYLPGQMDEMHCHNADQTFYCVEGECSMHFPDGGTSVMKPGDLALMPGGQFYQLHNTGEDKMVLLGSRAMSQEQSLKIDYETRKPIEGGRPRGKDAEAPRGTTVLV